MDILQANIHSDSKKKIRVKRFLKGHGKVNLLANDWGDK